MHQLQNSIWCIWQLNLQSRYSANCRIKCCSMSTSYCFEVTETFICIMCPLFAFVRSWVNRQKCTYFIFYSIKGCVTDSQCVSLFVRTFHISWFQVGIFKQLARTARVFVSSVCVTSWDPELTPGDMTWVSGQPPWWLELAVSLKIKLVPSREYQARVTGGGQRPVRSPSQSRARRVKCSPGPIKL